MSEDSSDSSQNSKDELRKKIYAIKKSEETKIVNNGGSETLLPLSWPEAGVGRYLDSDPPEQDYLFEKLILRKIVYGLFATGGTGKSYFLLQLAACLATGHNFGLFRPTRINRVLYLGAEDPDPELHRRVHLIAKDWGLLHSKDLINNLAVYPVVGKIGPLLMLQNNNPVTSEYYDWIKKSIENLKNIEVLILDPLSRFYGLNENDNTHGTAWIQMLERITLENNLSIIFAHHESKSASQSKNLEDSTGRGASSIRDGCRGAISMREMTENDGEKYNVTPREYVEIDVTKANYTSKLPSSFFLKRGEGGLLEAVNLGQDRLKGLAEALIEELSAQNNSLSRNDLQNNRGTAKNIIENLKTTSSFKLKDMGKIIDYSLEQGIIIEVDQVGTGRKKKILQIL